MTQQWRKPVPLILNISTVQPLRVLWCPFMHQHSKNHSFGTYSLIYKTNSTFVASRIVVLKLVEIIFSSSSYAPSFHQKHFYVFLSFIFITHFCGLVGACVNPRNFYSSSLFIHSHCLSNNSLID